MRRFASLVPLAFFPLLVMGQSVDVKPPAPESRATILCYHRFEEAPRDGLAIRPEDFRNQLQSLKDEGIEVISMNDFLAWRKGEKEIPMRSAVITIDDGYRSGYEVAWPILKEFGYPFTMFIYTEYVKGGKLAGGGSLTWQELAEMRDAGVDIGSHSLTHASLTGVKGRSPEEYDSWLREELAGSKKILEEKLGIPIRTFAYPYGHQDEHVRQIAAEAGYEAAFTVRGQKLGRDGDPMGIGRYAIDMKSPEVFAMATDFPSPVARSANVTGSTASTGTPPEHPVTPEPGTTIAGPLPPLSVDLSGIENIDPDSLTFRIGGLGDVPATYDATTGTLTAKPRARIYAPEVIVAVSGRAAGKRFETRWAYPTAIAMP